LSDGLANVGVTEPIPLQQIAQKAFREEGIGLSTFGVGADYNEELMQYLSEYGGANYYFIETPEQVPQIFAEELSGLLTVVAQNAKLTLNFETVLRCKKVYGYPADIKSEKVEINFNDIFSEEEKTVILYFETQNLSSEALHIACQLQYHDVEHTMSKVTEDKLLKVAITQDEVLVKTNINKKVIAETTLFIANELLNEAIKIMDTRQVEQAKNKLEEAKRYMEAQFNIVDMSEELQKLYENIKKYLNDLVSLSELSDGDLRLYQKASKMEAYAMKRKRYNK
ncbi:MAG: VWA domain-containing protein, partial [Bernardetiaceae bacterium]|nr:VWA domain-containing protein [Bernardetiaceae bacterium]